MTSLTFVFDFVPERGGMRAGDPGRGGAVASWDMAHGHACRSLAVRCVGSCVGVLPVQITLNA